MANSMTSYRKPQEWINLILAACLFVSPWVLGFTGSTMPARNAWIVGVILAVVAIASLSMLAEWEEWLSFLLGIWLIVSPWVLGFAADMTPMRTHVLLGVLTAIVSAWAVWDYRHTPHAA